MSSRHFFHCPNWGVIVTDFAHNLFDIFANILFVEFLWQRKYFTFSKYHNFRTTLTLTNIKSLRISLTNSVNFCVHNVVKSYLYKWYKKYSISEVWKLQTTKDTIPCNMICDMWTHISMNLTWIRHKYHIKPVLTICATDEVTYRRRRNGVGISILFGIRFCDYLHTICLCPVLGIRTHL